MSTRRSGPAGFRCGIPLALAWIGAVVGISISAHRSPSWIAALAASPDRIREGKLWYLFTSGMLVDRPLVASLVCFVALAALALFVCGLGTFWSAALHGQIAATLVVYVLIGAIRWTVPGALGSVVASPDYGVSTVSAAWLGAVATVGWRRRDRSRLGKLSIACSCGAMAIFAYSLRPDVTILSSEHLVAFALGIAAAVPGLWRRIAQRSRGSVEKVGALFGKRLGGRLSHSSATAVGGVAILFAAAAVPTGLAALRHEITIRLAPTATRCASAWNESKTAPKALAGTGRLANVSVTRDRPARLKDGSGPVRLASLARACSYAFKSSRGETVVRGRWRAGRVQSWSVVVHLEPESGPPNASIRRNGDLRLLGIRSQNPTLSS